MAVNVFGVPVTDDTVRLLFPNVTNILPSNRAEAALRHMNADNRATNANTFVHNLKAAYGAGTSTLGVFYNATGSDLSFVLSHDWAGMVWQSPYPQLLQNGQWGAFLHVRRDVFGDSKAAIVYRGTINSGHTRDWMFCFHTTRLNAVLNVHPPNFVYAEIRGSGGFGSANWNTIDNNMARHRNNFNTTQNGGIARTSVGEGSSPEFVAILTLEGLIQRAMELAEDISVISPSLDSKYDEVDGAEEGEEDAAPAAAAAAASTTATAE